MVSSHVSQISGATRCFSNCKEVLTISPAFASRSWGVQRGLFLLPVPENCFLRKNFAVLHHCSLLEFTISRYGEETHQQSITARNFLDIDRVINSEIPNHPAVMSILGCDFFPNLAGDASKSPSGRSRPSAGLFRPDFRARADPRQCHRELDRES
jgi:hypothetical protein